MFDPKNLNDILKKFQKMEGFEKHRKNLNEQGYSDLEIVTMGMYLITLKSNDKEDIAKMEEVIHLMIERNIGKALAPICPIFMNRESTELLIKKMTDTFFKELEVFKNIKKMEGNN